MHTRRFVFMLLAAAAAACSRRDAKPAAAAANPHYLAGVPRLPRSRAHDSTIGPEVEQRSFIAPFTMDSVASFYRASLGADGWQITGGTSDTGQITLYATRNGQPLWVLIHHVGLGQQVSGYSLTSAAAASDSGTAVRAPMLPPH